MGQEAEPLPTVDAYAPEEPVVAAEKRRAGHLVGMWRFFRARDASLLGKVLLVLSVVYVLSPIDLIPDVLPVVGWIDDLIVSIVAATYLFRSAQRYR
ncbi:MAG TPA: YkvA family protein [Polyangiaceae bacterium]|nr:YkvA family protein [Polyangiaceae bacterium]